MADDDPTRHVPAEEPGESSTRRVGQDDFATVRGLAAGQRLFGRYALDAEVGRGGMGVVWRARDLELERVVALKFLPEAVARDAEAVADLKRETSACLELTHPNIVRVHHFERDESAAAIVMEFIDGPTLQALRSAQPQRCFSPEEIADWVRQLCNALEYAHGQAHVVHRDLKPQNLMLNRAGHLKVTDFGIAGSLSETKTRLTGRSAFTPSYASPQQVRGFLPTVADDVYALGATLYDLLTGKPPFFRGDLAYQTLHEQPTPLAVRRAELGVQGLPPVPRHWEETILACLAKDPQNRPKSVGEIATKLQLGDGIAGVKPQAVLLRQGLSDLRRREFTVVVDPANAGARVWLGPASNVEVKDGRAVVDDVPDGDQELTVQADGYQPFTTLVAVKDGRGRAEVRLIAVKGAIAIKARPGTVVTAIDGRGSQIELGAVPAGGVLTSNNLLTVGGYTLKLAHADCAPVEMAGVELVIGRAVRVAPAQTLLPGELRVFSMPTGAEVRVNGVVSGSTPATIKSQPSEQALRLEVSQRGYRRVEKTVSLKPKEVRSVNVGTLTPENGGIDLRVSSSDFEFGQAQVSIDGKLVKVEQVSDVASGSVVPNAPFVVKGLEVGSRTVEITHPDYEPWKQAVAVRDQEATAVNVELKPKPGIVACKTTPAGARVVIGGGDQHETMFSDERSQAESLTPLRGSLPPGRYTLRFELKGFKTVTRSVTVEASRTVDVSAALEKLRAPEEEQAWTVPGLDLEMEFIQPGTFIMGSEGTGSESPRMQVTITKGYWLGRTEVTQGQWEMLFRRDQSSAIGRVRRLLMEPMTSSTQSKFKGVYRPMEEVSRVEAVEFCQKLTERERQAGRLREGYEYMLPTEAQWEHACRAGTTGDYAGNLDKMAWYNKNSGHTTHPVAQKQANVWRLYDMKGNVWEWCRDWYGQYPGGSVTDPTGPPSGSIRVVRGGSWNSPAQRCRSASRVGLAPDKRFDDVGFRLALSSVS